LNLLERFKNSVESFDLSGKTVRIALSGGADSVALLYLANSIERDFEIAALHIVHGIREEGVADAAFVREICDEIGVPLDVREVDAPGFADEHGLGIEEAARDLRYAIFSEFTDRGEIVMTAHNAGDVVETLLFNLARGSGPRGLSGIPKQRDNIVRPLLDLWRNELREWLESKGREWREDESNLDLRFSRNRVRWMLLPEMKRVFGDGVVERLRREADIFAASSEFLEDAAERLFCAAGIATFDGISVFDSNRATKTPWGFGEILRRCIKKFGVPLSNLDFDTVMRLYHNATISRKGRRYPIGGGLHIEIDGKLLFVFMEPLNQCEFSLQLPFEWELPDGMGRISISEEGNGVRVPYDEGALSLRPARPGDTIDTGRKLRRFLARKGVPRLLRDVVPVLFSGKTPIFSPITGKIGRDPGLFDIKVGYEGELSKIIL
jgi:tRNA(Ile)-lysidine synthetase-like protein